MRSVAWICFGVFSDSFWFLFEYFWFRGYFEISLKQFKKYIYIYLKLMMIWWYYDDDSMGIDTILLQYWYQLNQNGGQNDGKMWANICCIGNVLEHIWNIIWNSYEIMNIMSVSMEHLMTIWWTYDEHCMKFVWTLLRHVATRSMAPKFPHARPEKLGGGSLAGQFIRNNGRYAEGAISQSWWVFFLHGQYCSSSSGSRWGWWWGWFCSRPVPYLLRAPAVSLNIF